MSSAPHQGAGQHRDQAAAVILENTGTSDKLDGLLDVLASFGVVELVRTGAVAMVRSAEASSFFYPSGENRRRRTDRKDPLPT
jgi:hypothetical protein